jgi:L,D-transpeptidase catalytic domain
MIEMSAGRMIAVPAFALILLAATPLAAASPEMTRTDAEITASARAFVSRPSALEPQVLRLALRAAGEALSQGVAHTGLLTIVDYSRPSTEPRLWVLDLARKVILFEELVAHGKGSGDDTATSFSNLPGSHASSLGLFRTAEVYRGQHGHSLRLDGLEPGFNDLARERAIVMHGAAYVNEQISKRLGRLGRSFGCPAVRESVARPLIDVIKNGSLLFVYYPDHRWLRTSKFLNGAEATVINLRKETVPQADARSVTR